MGIDELQKKLYSKDNDIEKRSLAKDSYDPERKFKKSFSADLAEEVSEKNDEEVSLAKDGQGKEDKKGSKEEADEKGGSFSDIREDLLKPQKKKKKEEMKEDPIKEKKKKEKNCCGDWSSGGNLNWRDNLSVFIFEVFSGNF